MIAKDVAGELDMRKDSVRRDLREMAATGLCQRVHGGADLASPAVADHATRRSVAVESKARAADTYVLASAEKIGAASGFAVLPLAAVAGIVTDAPGTDALVDRLVQRLTPG